MIRRRAQLRDGLNFASKFSWKKARNAAALFTSYQWSKQTKKPVHWGLPMTISVEPTTTCNLGCPECPSGLKSFTRPTGKMDLEAFSKWLDPLAAYLSYIYFYFQGEPYLHPQFLDMVREADRQKIYSVTSTNAHFLSPRRAAETIDAGLDRIIISVDGTDQQTYEQYRKGGSLDKVLRGTENLLEARAKAGSARPYAIFQFLVVKPNEHQIHEVQALGRKMGVDEVKLKTAQIYDYADGSPLIPDNERYSRYRIGADGQYEIKSAWLDHCWKMWHACVWTWDGRVVPCCFDKDAEHQMGDLGQSGFREIWDGPGYRDFRAQILRGRDQVEMCRNCSEGLKVWG